MAKLDGIPENFSAAPDNQAHDRVTKEPPESTSRLGRARRMKTDEMVERGLLTVGTELTIKDRPDSVARVIEGRHVEFRGERMTFNAWGCQVTGWSAIQIYKWAVMPDGRLLEALREQNLGTSKNKDEI